MSDKDFMPHLTGLRGAAILLVVLFHLNTNAWPHGYLGVDVFLVISGYLLFFAKAKSKGSVTNVGGQPLNSPVKSTWLFLQKRIVRIVPPMVILILLAAAVGILFMGWNDLKFLSIIGMNASKGVANIKLAQAVENYFSADGAFIPLLHMWYLSVILQVYLIWAVGNLLLRRLPKKGLIAICSIIAAASLAYQYSFPVHEWLESIGCSTWTQKSGASYYATLPRLWEVLAGGVVLFLPALPKHAWSTLVSALGLCGILLPAIIGEHFPAPLTLTVVISTVLVIRYLPESHLKQLLCNKALLWLGGISFSVYLVHMPIIVYVRMWTLGSPLGIWEQAGILALSFAVGGFFWWAVEKRKFPLWLTLLLWLTTLFACHQIRKHNGFKNSFSVLPSPTYDAYRVSPQAEALSADWSPKMEAADIVFRMMRQPIPRTLPVPILTMGVETSAANVVLMGDSHAACLYAGMDHVGKEEGLAGIYLSSIVFAFHHQKVFKSENYQFNPEKEAALMKWLKESPELTHIVISQRWSQLFPRHNATALAQKTAMFRRFLRELKELGKEVIIIGPQPEFSIDDYFRYERIRSIRGQEQQYPVCTLEQYKEAHATSYEVLRQIEAEGLCTLIDITKALEPGESFLSVRDGMMQMSDDDHSYCGNAIWLVHRLLPQLRRALPFAKQQSTQSADARSGEKP